MVASLTAVITRPIHLLQNVLMRIRRMVHLWTQVLKRMA